jgi:hypothetical protein
MSTHPTVLQRWLQHASAVVLLLATAACIKSPPPIASIAIPPVPAGDARVWFYRPIDAYDSLATPFIRMNDQIVAVSMPSGASYRDVPAGPYHIAVDSYGTDSNQDKDVQLAAGQELYVKVVSLRSWSTASGASGPDGGGGDYGRDTFYAWLIPAEIARDEVARSAFYGS